MKRLRTQRLWLVTALFVAIVGVILLIAVQQAAALSDVRAYTTGEGLYSKAQKRAVIGLQRYARSRAEADYRVFTESIAVPIGDRDARRALQREEPDLDAAVDGFLRGNNHADDVASMARFFIRFDWISYVADAIRIWTLADAEVAQLVALGEELHRRMGTGNATEAEVGLLLAKVVAVDERLTILEDRFSDTLGQGARFVTRVTTFALLFVALLLIALGLLATRRMVHQIQHAESEVLQSEARYRTLSENMIDGILILQDGRFVHTNPAALALLGYTMDELFGQPFVPMVHADFRALVAERHRRRLAGETLETHYDIQVVTKSGVAVWVQVANSRIDWNDQPAVLTIIADITERKRLVDSVRRMNEELEERVALRTAELSGANEALVRSNMDLQRFAYVASHDLQTPMRAVASFVELLRSRYSDKLDAQAIDWIGRTVASIKHLQTLVRDLLEYSRVDAQPRPFEVVSFRDVFDHVVSLLHGSLHETGAEVTCGELPMVTGDRSQLAQLMLNLIGNSLKYRGSDTLRVHVSAELKGDVLVFAVRDNGIGIGLEFHERIFEIFQRLHGPQDYPGTGIGLAICKRVVERHGGRIWVESEMHSGSVFYFTIPERKVDPS